MYQGYIAKQFFVANNLLTLLKFIYYGLCMCDWTYKEKTFVFIFLFPQTSGKSLTTDHLTTEFEIFKSKI